MKCRKSVRLTLSTGSRCKEEESSAQKGFSVPNCSALCLLLSCGLATLLEKRKGSSELLEWALKSVWQIDACFGNLITQRWEHRASSPFPWSGTFPFQLAEHRSHKNGRSNSPCRTAEDWFFIFLISASFAPLHFHFQEVDAVVVIPWDTCYNLGIDRVSWGKKRAPGCLFFFFFCSKLDVECDGRYLTGA